MDRGAVGTLDLSGHTFVVVYDFMAQELHLKGSDLLVYARIFGFHQAGRDYYESKHGLASFFGFSDRTAFESVSRLIERGLIEEVEPCAEAARIGSKCYVPAPEPLDAAITAARTSEEPAEGASAPAETSGAAGSRPEKSSEGRPFSHEDSAEVNLQELHPIAKANNSFFK
ncbi:hypothetical protein [Slackia isoflavoniconvertens]|uniref:hypothetical protein n=1 Tax=Slackia isoflavoniconvertens TaxID=572010 RepID=UPI003F9A991C